MATRAIDLGLEARSEPRDEVDFRTKGSLADERTVQLTIVNVSPGGLMARCESRVAVGDMIRVRLPVIGNVVAEVRWALGGRIGCRLGAPVTQGNYYAMLARMGAFSA